MQQMSLGRMILIISLFLLYKMEAAAQFKSATIGIDGLTCSACSYGTEQSIRKLEFVSDVKTDLNTTTAAVFFSPSTNVSINELVRKVSQAGYSVRFTKAIFHFNRNILNNGDTIMINNEVYYVLDSKSKIVDGDTEMEFIGDKFSSKKTLQHWQFQIKEARLKFPLLPHDTYFVVL